MRVSIHSDLLNSALSKLLTVVDKKNSRPILTYCQIVTNHDSLELLATDLEVSVKVKVKADVFEPGKFCIHAKNISDILREMPSDEIHLEIDQNFNILKLRCQEIKFSLLICKAEEFPQLNFQNFNNKFFINSGQVQNIINKTYHALPVDETRPFLNGIFFQQIDSKLRAVATDGHRLALIDLPDFQSSNDMLIDGIIIPKKGINEIKKLSDSFPNENLEFSLDDSFIYVNANDSYFLSIRLIAREFPKYQTIIPMKTTFRMTVDKNILLTAVKRIKILASERSNGVKLSLQEGCLILSANHPSLGGATEKIQVDYSGREIDIGFNAKYLIDTLSILNDAEVSFEFNNELSPLLIKSINVPEFLGIIMPLKL